MSSIQDIIKEARALYQCGQISKSIEVIEHGMIILDSPDQLVLQRIQFLETMGMMTDKELSNLKSTHGHHIRALKFIMNEYLNRGQFDEAQSQLDSISAIAKTTKIVEEIQLKAKIEFHLAIEKYSLAKQFCLEYIHGFPDQIYGHRKLVITLSRLRDLESLQELQDLRKKYKDSNELKGIYFQISVLCQQIYSLLDYIDSEKLKETEQLYYLHCLLYLNIRTKESDKIISSLLTGELRLPQTWPILAMSKFSDKLSSRLLNFFDDNPHWKAYKIVRNFIELERQSITAISSPSPTNKASASLSFYLECKLDIVFTWVDLEDKHLQEKYKKQFGSLPEENENKQAGIVRFENNKEIQLALKSIQKFLSWVNNIYIVTNEQTFDLSFLNQEFSSKIRFVDHKEIIPSDLVNGNVFHSNLIENFIYNIPKLEEHFLYFCDDMILGRSITYRDLFNNRGQSYAFIRPVLDDFYTPIFRLSAFTQMENISWKYGMANASFLFNEGIEQKVHYTTNHQCLLMHKSTFKDTVDKYIPEWKDTFFKELLRGPSAVFTPLLVCLKSIQSGHQVIASPNLPYYNSRIFGLGIHDDICQYILAEKCKFYCLNYIIAPASRANLEKLIEEIC